MTSCRCGNAETIFVPRGSTFNYYFKVGGEYRVRGAATGYPMPTIVDEYRCSECIEIIDLRINVRP